MTKITMLYMDVGLHHKIFTSYMLNSIIYALFVFFYTCNKNVFGCCCLFVFFLRAFFCIYYLTSVVLLIYLFFKLNIRQLNNINMYGLDLKKNLPTKALVCVLYTRQIISIP